MAKRTNENNIAYYAEKYFRTFSNTISLSKNEEILRTIGMEEAVNVSYGAYLYYNKLEKVDEQKFPLTFELLNEFIKRKDLDKPFNKHKLANDHINILSRRSEINDERKERLILKINKIIKKKNISIYAISKEYNIDHSNLYKVLSNGKINTMKMSRMKELYNYVKEFDK